ncbi:MAG: ABC transporter permease [Chloroflexota bacterium]
MSIVSQVQLGKPSLRQQLKEAAVPSALIFPAAFLLVAFFLAPTVVVLDYSLLSNMPFVDPHPHYTLANYARVLTEPIYVNAFIRTALYALVATSISLVISYPVAYYLARKSARGGLILLVLLIPFWTSIVLRVFSWKIILGPSGMLNSALLGAGIIQEPISFLYSPAGVLFGLVYSYTPYLILPLYGVLGKVPQALLEASEDLGANKLQTLLRITLPLTSSGTISAVLLVLLACFGDVLSSNLLGGPNTLMVSTVIFETFFGGANWTVGSALSVVVFVILLVVAALLSLMGKEVEYA